MSREQGNAAERLAERWLVGQGLKPVARQLKCRFGELDLVMRQRQSLVLLEVKYRRQDINAAMLSVTPAKQRRLSKAARWLYSQHPEWQALAWRFDVLAVAGDLEQPQIKWVPAAFELLGE